MAQMPTELQAARLRLVKDRPYLASAAWALVPIAKPGLETLAVDMFWRLYYDPAVTARWTVEELAGVLYHEVMHLMRDHPKRLKDLDSRISNIAADAEINDDLLAEGVKLPKGAVTPATLGQPDGLLAEEYYTALQARQSASEQGALAQKTAQDKGPSSAGHGGGEEAQSDPSQADAGGGRANDARPDKPGSSTGSKAGDPGSAKSGGEKAGRNSGSSPGSSPSGQLSSSSAQPGNSSRPSPGSGSGRDQGQDGGKSGVRAQTPAPAAGRCGSCATGQREPWEEGPPREGASPGISRAEGDLIRRDVARQVKEHVQGLGNVPGHWARWAEEKLRPRVDWRRKLAAVVRHAVADVSGASDYSYRRPSRRQGQAGNGKVVLPSLRRPVPNVAIVVDTSGSMSDNMLAQALAEISGILRGLGQREGVTVLSVDTAVNVSRKVFDARQVKLAGGGGTDMGAGLYAAQKLRPAPQVCIVISDFYTPWPAAPPRGMRIIGVALGKSSNVESAPQWMRVIRVEGG